jgi:bifunctional DNase/RNase
VSRQLLRCAAVAVAAALCACHRGAAPGAAETPNAIEPPSPKESAEAPMIAATAPSPGMVRVDVADLLSQPMGGAVVLLVERASRPRVVPMVIGDFEASAIALRIGRRKFDRPLTHDLLESILASYDIRIAKLEIDALESGVFLGRLFLQERSGRVTKIDARPSDGIALAIGAEAPIFMSAQILEQAGEPAGRPTPEGASPRAEPPKPETDLVDPKGAI